MYYSNSDSVQTPYLLQDLHDVFVTHGLREVPRTVARVVRGINLHTATKKWHVVTCEQPSAAHGRPCRWTRQLRQGHNDRDTYCMESSSKFK